MKDAINYSLNQEKYLVRFLEDGRIPMTNAACERAIKPVALLRRNSLFFNTARGAKAGMVIHSLVETARRNGANPELYLQYVLENALDYKEVTDRKKLDELMPWSEKFKAWQHGKLMDNKAFSLNSDEKPYYRPSKDRIDIENDRINKNYCYRIPHMIKSYHQETKTNESQINTIKTTHQARRKLQWQITRTWNLMMI